MFNKIQRVATAAVTVLALAPWCVATAASALSSTKFGTALAQDCYRAADDRLDLRAGIAVCNQALAEEIMRPRDRAATLVNRGILKLLMNDADGALADYNAGIAVAPELGDAWVNRGLWRMRRGNEDALAIADITKGLALGSRDESAAYYGRGLAYESVGQLTDAYHDYQRAAALNPKWAAPREELARFAVRKKE